MITERNMQHGFLYSGQNVTGWMLSEKYNGVRAYWDGSEMWTRGGKIVAIPASMRKALPGGIHLDGEICAGRYRSGFETARQAVQYGKFTDDCVYAVFDAPDIHKPFSERYDFMRYILPRCGTVHYAEQIICLDISHAVDTMLSIQSSGGEGIIVRSPDAIYFPGRTEEILKLKRIPRESSVPALR